MAFPAKRLVEELVGKGNDIWATKGRKASSGGDWPLLTVPATVRAGKYSGGGAHNTQPVVRKDGKRQYCLSAR